MEVDIAVGKHPCDAQKKRRGMPTDAIISTDPEKTSPSKPRGKRRAREATMHEEGYYGHMAGGDASLDE